MEINRATTRRQKETRHFARYRQIAAILIKYRLGEFVQMLGLEHYLPFSWIPPGNPWRKEVYSVSQRTRMALEEAGNDLCENGPNPFHPYRRFTD